MSIVLGIDPSVATSAQEHLLGSIGEISDSAGTREYKYVRYYAGTAALAGVIGEVTYYYLAGGTDDNYVTSDVSDSVNVGAGVLECAPADTEYCWVQISGKATLSIALTAGADGNALTPVGAGDGTLDVSALVTDHICAIADDISAKEIVCCFPR